jgi:DNA (cytosine-5)-methyltransferase 1
MLLMLGADQKTYSVMSTTLAKLSSGPMNDAAPFSVVSLFCGCGGLDVGFKELGFDLVYACDNDPASCACYTRNIDRRVFHRDVLSSQFHDDLASIGSCDVVLGGFPCQGFSKAGPKRFDDERNTLYKAMLHAVATLRPKLFIAENVDGLSQNFRGGYLAAIVSDFRDIEYRVEHRVLDALAFGIPQHRRRIIFVGVDGSHEARFDWPQPSHVANPRNGESALDDMPLWSKQPLCAPLTIGNAIADLLELGQFPDHEVTNAWPAHYADIFRVIKQGQKLCNVRHATSSVYTWDIPTVFGQVTERQRMILTTIATHRRHKLYGDIPNGNPLPLDVIEDKSGLRDIQDDLDALLSLNYLKVIDGKYDLKGAMFCSGLFKRPYWNEPLPTVLTNFHNPRYFLHPLRDRPFSARECARLQGFDDTFEFCGLDATIELVDRYRLIGNAVPPPLSRHLAQSVLSYCQSIKGARR